MARNHRDWLGSFIGLLVFLGGIALLALTFKLAFDMFNVPPEDALKIKGTKTVDLAQSGGQFVGIIVRTLLLLVMGLVSSLIANRGILLYMHSLHRTADKETQTP
ncbi:MAG TPA: hypothetical protein VG944_05225 [Fimbriimonas sp.]|nr:hypothetical protein [Fimbriimonas sp.]